MSAFWWYSSCTLLTFCLQSHCSLEHHANLTYSHLSLSLTCVPAACISLACLILTKPVIAMARLLDTAMAKYGGKSWALRALQSPTSGSKNEDTIEDPVSLPDFVAGVCRTVNGMASLTILFDVQMSVPDFGPPDQVADAVTHGDTAALRDSIRPLRDLPDGRHVGAHRRPLGHLYV